MTLLYIWTNKQSLNVRCEEKSVCELGAGMGKSGLAAVIVRTSRGMMIDFGVRSICNESLALIFI